MKKIKALLYCTKAKTELFKTEKGFVLTDFGIGDYFKQKIKLNGTIVAECEIEVEEIYLAFKGMSIEEYVTSHFKQKELLKKSCLTSEELENYLQDKNGYALHISNIKVFDKPRELINYHTLCNGENESKCRKCFYHFITSNEGVGLEEECLCDNKPSLLKAPQNMMNVYDRLGNHYVLISIQPQWLCKELNREKDIEVRKQVLNYMKGNE